MGDDRSQGGVHHNHTNTYNIHVDRVDNFTSGTNNGHTNQHSTPDPSSLYQPDGKGWISAGTVSIWGVIRSFLLPVQVLFHSGGAGTRQTEPTDIDGNQTSTTNDGIDTDFRMLSMDDLPEQVPRRLGPALHEIYVRTLLAEGYGLPCWEPRPLEPKVQPKGVVPGDVGTYTPEGGFRRTFNLLDDCHFVQKIPHTVQINPPRVPQGLKVGVVPRQDMLLEGETIVRGASTEKSVCSGRSSEDFTYEFHRHPTAPAGAILALTSSADKEEVADIEGMRKYIIQHAEAIYRHAISIRAIGEEESFYIVTGCIKSDSWAMAAYDEGMDHNHSTLCLERRIKARGGNPPRYEWTRQGSSRARVGRSDRRKVKDQILFLQGFKLVFSPRFRYQVEAGSSGTSPNHQGSGPGDMGGHQDRPGAPDGGPHPGSRRNGNGRGPTIGWAGQSSTYGHMHSAGSSELPLTRDPYDIHCTSLSYRTKMAYHPSDAINALLLQETGCDIAICHDNSWRFLLKSCCSLQTTEEDLKVEDLPTRIGGLGNRDIGIHNDVAFLLPTEFDIEPASLRIQEQLNHMRSAARGSVGAVEEELNLPIPAEITKEQPLALGRNVGSSLNKGYVRPRTSRFASDLKIRANDVVIVMMGLSGSGRSTFINALLPQSSPQKRVIGKDGTLSACTKTVEHVVVDIQNEYRLILVDTPGLDPKDGSDSDVMNDISTWAAQNLPPEGCRGGIIFLYDICPERLKAGSEIETLSQSFNISAKSKQLVIVTSKWRNLGKNLDKGEARHTSLIAQLSKSSSNAPFHKFKEDKDAWPIVKQFLAYLERAPRVNFNTTFNRIKHRQEVKEKERKSGFRKFLSSLAFWR